MYSLLLCRELETAQDMTGKAGLPCLRFLSHSTGSSGFLWRQRNTRLSQGPSHRETLDFRQNWAPPAIDALRSMRISEQIPSVVKWAVFAHFDKHCSCSLDCLGVNNPGPPASPQPLAVRGSVLCSLLGSEQHVGYWATESAFLLKMPVW